MTPSPCAAAAASATPAIAGAILVGARTIIAVDVDPRKLEGARQFGTTHTVNASKDDPVERIRQLTDGNGADVCIEAVGKPEVLEQAFTRAISRERSCRSASPPPTWRCPTSR